MRYFITFACYGATYTAMNRVLSIGATICQAHPQRAAAERQLMDQAPYFLDRARRTIVLEALRQVCLHRGWTLLAAQVRTNDVHVIVEADLRPEKVMNDLKSYASRSLNRLGSDEPDRKRWARHGSTRWLWKDKDVQEATRYVIEEQGEPMAVFAEEVL